MPRVLPRNGQVRLIEKGFITDEIRQGTSMDLAY